jgi:hypothetical protein
MEKAASPQHQLRFDNAVMPEKAAFFYFRSGQLLSSGEKSGLVVLFPGDTSVISNPAPNFLAKMRRLLEPGDSIMP